jgi:hypothetical protein
MNGEIRSYPSLSPDDYIKQESRWSPSEILQKDFLVT